MAGEFKTDIRPQRYSFCFNGDPASCEALSDLFRADWALAISGATQTREGFHWIELERWSKPGGETEWPKR